LTSWINLRCPFGDIPIGYRVIDENEPLSRIIRPF